MNFFEYRYSRHLRQSPVTEDSAVSAEHDKRFHKGHFDPRTMHCGLRDELKKHDKDDVLEKASPDSETVTLPSGKIVHKELAKLFKDENGKFSETMTSPFLKSRTGDGTVSKVMRDIVLRLFSGEDVPDEEILATPEWKTAMEIERQSEERLKKKYGVTRTNEIDTPERNLLRKRILDAALSEHIAKTVPVEGFEGVEFETNEGLKDGESYDVDRGHKAFIAIGFPAAGKSTTYANPIAKTYHARLCDSDTVKKVLPEFDNGYGGNLVHEESTAINEAILAKATDRGDNVVYPILGFKPEKLRKVIDEFRRKGYSVALCFKDMPVNLAKGRLLVRFLNKGRYLPLQCISKAKNGLDGSFNANKGLVDAYIRSTNKSGYSNEEVILESKGKIL